MRKEKSLVRSQLIAKKQRVDHEDDQSEGSEQVHKTAKARKSVPKVQPAPTRTLRSKSKPAEPKSRVSRSANPVSISDQEDEVASDEEVFAKDSFVVFIDKEAVEKGLQQMSIGKVLQTSQKDGKDIQVAHFDPEPKQKIAMNFTLVDELILIQDYQIICSIDVDKQSNKSVSITKKSAIEVTKLLYRMYDTVRDKINQEIDEEAEKESSSEKDDEEDEDAEPSILAKRTIVKGKRNIPQTQLDKSVSKTAVAAKAVKKKPSKDSESDNEGDEAVDEILPKVGKKRSFPTSIEALSMSQPSRKIKKLAEGATQSITVVTTKKAKTPAVKKSKQVFKLGKWNPDTVLVKQEEEIEFNDLSDSPIYKCCVRCNSRNVVRAVHTNNIRLLRAVLHAKDQIPNVCARWSQDAPSLNPLEMIIKSKNLELFEAFFKIPVANKAEQSEYQRAANQFFLQDRVKVRESLLTRIDTGKVSYKAYGTNVRSVQMTRGNRQGNQAFVMRDEGSDNPLNIEEQSYFVTYVTPEIYQAWCVLTRKASDMFYQLQKYAVAGNIEMLIWAVEPMIKQENYGFNKLHLDVLKLDKLTEKYHTASITKKAAQSGLTPLHFACLNPSKAVLTALLEQNNDINVFDAQNNKLVHFAAICSSPGPLQVLIEKGANVFDFNTEKKTPLHFAAIHNRPLNVKTLLESNLLTIRYRDKQNKTAFAYACENGDIQTIQAFLDYSGGKIKINTGQGIDRMTPLMYAAAQGNYELAEFLLERKARVLSKDKFKRTALIMAVRNGHTRLASLLLQHGSDWKHLDSSNNTALHYAAGNGFIECIDLLIKHQADVNAMNSWKVTPITIAMLNNHLGTVKRLLKEELVDVNGKDDQGRTLLSMAMLNLEEPTCIEFTKFLLSKGADVNLGDVNMVTPLHILAAYKPTADHNLGGQARLAQLKHLQKVQSDMIDLLLSHGANLSAKTDEGLTPFVVALDCNNIEVLQKLISNVKLNENPEILHKFKSKIFDERFRAILIQLLNQELNLQSQTMNFLDDQGFSPFLQYINQYVDSVKSNVFSQSLRTILKWNSLKHGLNFHKYLVTNSLIFDQTQIQNDEKFHKIHDFALIPLDKEEQLVKQYTYELITKPFIEFLQIIIAKGANPHEKVGKTKFYRELDEHKRHLLLVGEAREAVGAVQGEIQIDTVQKPVKGQVKTRKEVLAERRIEKKTKTSKADKQQDRIAKPLKEFYAKRGYLAQFMKKDGKTIEIEYNKEFGLQNAIHILFKHPSVSIYEFLVDKLGLAIDETDFMGRNPFMINVAAYPNRTTFGNTIDKLLKRNIRFDLADSNNRTPFLIYYENHNNALANKLLDMGANINQMDRGGLFALKYALIRRQDEEIKRLVARGANINLIDNKGRNLLHHAVNMSSSTADATFETEQTLIDLGIHVNLRDNKGRVPLHYAFVKIKNWRSNDQIDPIETVSSLCGQPGLEIEVADKWKKTPLHYAAQRSATICTLYILQRGANIESLDIYGNSALGVCLLNKHYNYAILLIQKNANVCLPVFDEFPNKIAKQWEEEAKLKRKLEKELEQKAGNQDIDMESSVDEEEEKKLGRDLFKKKVAKNFFYNYNSSGSEYSEEESEEEDEEAHEQNVFNQQNAFGMNVFAKSAARKVRPYNQFGMFGQTNFGMPAYQTQQQSQTKEVEKEKPPRSTFRHAIQNQQQGLAYLILDNKYDYMLAMQDALDEKKFNLVLTLLSKTADNRIVQRKNELNQNLMHILAKNSNGGQFHILKRIYDQLKKRGVNCFEKDSLGNNALHYSVISSCYDLCEILINEGININEVNVEGQSPFSLYMKGETGAALVLKKPDQIDYQLRNFFYLLASNGADVNFRYPENSFGENDYKCNVMINMIRRSTLDFEQLRQNLLCLFQFNASIQVTDSKGQDLIMHSIMQNNEKLVNFFINHAIEKNAGQFFKVHRDLQGKNAIHYIVNPHPYGSFENEQILNILCNSGIGYDLAAADKFGKTPIDYANLQKSGVLATALSQRIGSSSKLRKIVNHTLSYIPIAQWPERSFDFDSDSHQLLADAEAKKAQELMEESKDNYIPLDPGFNNEKQYKVYFEGSAENRRPYDVYMTKVDLKNGMYGDYTFYKMQMVYDSNRDLYIVLTRYGRIGEEGMNQRTPFNTAEEAKKEFATIFKQKSANEWETAHEHFIEQPKKYVPVHVDYSNVKHKDYLAPFDYDNCAKSKLEKPIRLLIEEISNVTMYQRSLSEMGIDQSQMPISNLKKETLNKAKQILSEINQALTGIEKIRASQFQAGVKFDPSAHFDELHKEHLKISDLTSQFYKLVPMKETDYWTVRPITQKHTLQQLQEKMDTLTNIEFSSRILLGALYKQMIVHPCDYVLDNIQTQFRLMQTSEPEYQLIAGFINNTRERSQKIKFNLFKIQRKGEGERYEKFQSLQNRRLLFHGTQLTNMLGILAQGLRIAPPEAPTTGYMFGKGLYFADLFKKSANYCGNGAQSRLMLLCEVALGKYMNVYKQVYVENLPLGYNSTRAIGKMGGNYEKTIVTPEGFQVPLGGEVQQKEPTENEFNESIRLSGDAKTEWRYYFNSFQKHFNWQLQNNEYIVYNPDQVKMRYVIQWEHDYQQ